MDLWVVKYASRRYASRRSRIGDFSTPALASLTDEQKDEVILALYYRLAPLQTRVLEQWCSGSGA